MRAILALAMLCLPVCAEAKPSRYPPVTQFNGDRYASVAQGGTTARDITRRPACPPLCGKAKQRKPKYKRGREPGSVDRLTKRNIFHGFAETLRDAGPSKSLAGVVAPLASKARQIQAACGSRVISAVRHTYIAGTGGRLSLHASGRAVDMAGSPACMYAQLRGWPGGYSVDYGRVRHIHISYAPGGPEWGIRFNHYRGGKRRHARGRA